MTKVLKSVYIEDVKVFLNCQAQGTSCHMQNIHKPQIKLVWPTPGSANE